MSFVRLQGDAQHQCAGLMLKCQHTKPQLDDVPFRAKSGPAETKRQNPGCGGREAVFVPDALTRHPRSNRGSMHHSRPASIGRHSWYVAHVKGGRETNGPDAHARTVGHLQHRLNQTARRPDPSVQRPPKARAPRRALSHGHSAVFAPPLARAASS